MTPKERACIDLVLSHEGGYSSNPKDPGNWTSGTVGIGVLRGTMHGIAASSHPTLDIANLTLLECETMYEAEYCPRMKIDALPIGLGMAALDAEVMSGFGDNRHERAAAWLQEAVGVPADSVIGPATVAAANACDVKAAIRSLCAARLAFLHSLKTWPTFGDGWSARVQDTLDKALGAS